MYFSSLESRTRTHSVMVMPAPDLTAADRLDVRDLVIHPISYYDARYSVEEQSVRCVLLTPAGRSFETRSRRIYDQLCWIIRQMGFPPWEPALRLEIVRGRYVDLMIGDRDGTRVPNISLPREDSAGCRAASSESSANSPLVGCRSAMSVP